MPAYPRHCRIGILTAMLFTLAALPVHAQRRILAPADPGVQPAEPAIALPTDRKTSQILAAAEEVIKEGEWRQAIRALQAILDAPEDAFVTVTRPGPDGKQVARVVFARAEANRLLQTLPAAGRAAYQKQVGDDAAQRLAQAKQLGDPNLLADVTRRYWLTPSGPEAATLLATHHLNRDEPLLAALWFGRLFERVAPDSASPLVLYPAALAFARAGDKNKSEAFWKQVADKIKADGGLTIEKKFVPLKNLREELDRAGKTAPDGAADWLMYRGGSTRTELAAGGAPFLESTWTLSTLPETKTDVKNWTQDNLTHAQRWLDQRGLPVLPAFFPIAVKDKLVYRSYDGVYAVSLKREGKLDWFSQTEGGLHALLADPTKKAHIDQWNQFYRQNGPFTTLFANSVIGSLSSDGQRVFAVDDLALPPHPYLLRNLAFAGPQPNFGSLNEMVNRNSLKAYNIATGKLVWELSGKFDKDDPATGTKASALAESFVLAPPLPLAGKLYVLSEKQGELRLVCLEPADTPLVSVPPKLIWSQTLALVKDKVTFDFNRRIHAAHLAYADGLLVCPTNTGAILGVDLLTHNLIWAFSYREANAANAPNPALPFNRFGQQQLLNINTEWHVAAPAISDGKVVFTAPDASNIHCLDLRDGSLLWKVPRAADDLYFAGVIQGKVVVVGKNYVKALSLATGKEDWPQLNNIGMPSGQGGASDNIYYLPLKAGDDKEPEICAIDVVKGQVIAHIKSRKKELPGNLIFHGGEMFSQTLIGISAYPQLQQKLNQIDERLKQNPKDPVGLHERAELRLDRGDLTGALSDLQTAIANKPPPELLPKTRQKLYETLTELLQRDFAAGEKHLDEYKALGETDNPEEKRRRQQTYFLVLAKGREQQSRLTDALQAYLDFGGMASDELLSVIDEPNTKARPDVWVRGRIAALFSKATPAQRKELDAKVAERWQTIAGKADVNALRGFASVFGEAATIGRQAKVQLAQRLMEQAKDPKSDDLREAQLYLLQLRAAKETDLTTAGQAVDLLARLMVQKGLLPDAAHYYQELGRDFGKVIIRDNKTGRDIYNEIITDKRFQPFLEGAKAPAPGKYTASEIAGNFPMIPSFTVELVGELTPSVQQRRLALELNTQRLRLLDKATGAERWQSPALPSLQYLQHGHPNIRTVCAVQGSVGVVNLGHMVYAFDLLDGAKLWEFNLYAPGTNQNPNLGQVTRDRDGNLVLLYQDGWTLKLGVAMPVAPAFVCLQTRMGLVAVDPLKGNVQWSRSDINTNRTQLFGDAGHIFLTEVNADGVAGPSTRALRALDGAAITVPNFETAYRNRIGVVGRTLLVREETAKGVHLWLYDPLTGKDVWEQTWMAGALVLKSNGDFAAVVEPDGTLTVIDLPSRKEMFKTALKKEHLEKVNEGHLLADAGHVYVILNQPPDMQAGNVWINVFHGMRCVGVNGTIYGLRRDGTVLWHNPVAKQMLVMEQFADLPILLFTARSNDWLLQGGNRINQHVVKVLTIQKQTGKRLFDKQINANINNFHTIVADAQAGTIDLISFNMKIRHALDKPEGK
ncbi:hypothetical protein AYO44_07255 [Planctomycetaceae bacterium SCGC AG-212-F19]|nr:hypothetical protein AYO44_07255 [Planctomycetaceae bacterium SCGC AG-212-F19]